MRGARATRWTEIGKDGLAMDKQIESDLINFSKKYLGK